MRLPLAVTLQNRDASTDKDALLRNAYRSDNYVVKRPALVNAFAVTAGHGCGGQGLASFQAPGADAVLVSINCDVLRTTATPAANALIISTQPSNVFPGIAITPAVVVEVVDDFGSIIASFTGNVTLSLGTNPSGATLSGTLTAAAVAGVATFSNVKLDKTGVGYTLVATASL